MKSKAIIPLAVGLAVGGIAIKYTFDTVRAAQGKTADTEMVTVLLAVQDIPATVEVTPDMIRTTQIPQTPLLPPDTFKEPENLVGRVTLKAIPQGMPVLPSMIAPEGSKAGLPVRVKEGYRAVAVKIDESSGVGYLVHPGDWVDVLAVQDTRRHGKQHTESKLILERVAVAAVGQLLNDQPEEGANRHAQTVTLLVEVDDVPKLHLAQTRGRITLALRGSDDMTTRIDREDDEDEDAVEDDGEQTAIVQAAPVPTPQPVVTTHTVTVVNSSATEESSVEEVTYAGDGSMDVVEMTSGGRTIRRSAPRTTVPGPVGPAVGAAGEDNRYGESREQTPSEVTE